MSEASSPSGKKRQKSPWNKVKEAIFGIRQANMGLSFLQGYRDFEKCTEFKKPNVPFFFIKKNKMAQLRRMARLFRHKTVEMR